MFGWFRRKPGFAEFASPLRARRIRNAMKAANPKMHVLKGFEKTIAERAAPLLGGEIAESQSLRSARKIARPAQQKPVGGRRT